MDELFRFNVARPLDRASGDGVSLNRPTPLQETLHGLAGQGVGWPALRDAVWDVVQELGPELFGDRPGTHAGERMEALDQLVERLRGVAPAADPASWRPAVTAMARSADFGPVLDRLADQFIALLILRSGGPAVVADYLRTVGSTQPWADLLHDRPSLDRLGDRIRLVALLHRGAAAIGAMTTSQMRAALRMTLLIPPGIFSPVRKPVQAVGVTDLLVVKQHIVRYEAGEIARIENVLKGESRGHAQKHTLSNERDVFVQTETTTQKDEELTSNDHVNIRNEAESTLKQDTKIDAGVHAQYGTGSFKLQADFTTSYDKSSTESKKYAAEVARDVTQKAATKVARRIVQAETTKIIETFEDSETQTFENVGGNGHVIGVYQWMEKVYLAQVFNYGKHLLFDLMVPEPAANLLKLSAAVRDRIAEPVPPQPLLISPLELSTDPDDPNFYGNLVARYQVTGVEPPPTAPITLTVSKAVPYEDNTVKFDKDMLRIDEGYAAARARATVTWQANDDDKGGQGSSPQDSFVNLVVGAVPMLFTWDWAKLLGGLGDLVSDTREFGLNPDDPDQPLEERSIGYVFSTNLVNALTLNLEITCLPTESLLTKWRIQTYEKIVARWQKLQEDYLAKLAQVSMDKEEAGTLGAADPEQNRQTERTELIRSCIALLDNGYEHVRGTDATTEWGIGVDPDVTAEQPGVWVRWFQQAFEWDKIGYVFYPYFWADPKTWSTRICPDGDDPLFTRFLQAGYARVAVPVRNGFEAAVNFYLLTGLPWLGGGLPSIGDEGQNPLYLSVAEEIKEAGGAPGDEVPVGDPWEVRLPTRLIRLRKEVDGTTPRWTRAQGATEAPDHAWSWKPKEPADSRTS